MISQQVFDRTLLDFFAPIRVYLDDPSVTEVMINGPDLIYIERGGIIERTPARFDSLRALIAALRNAAQFVGKAVDEERPILEGRLPDGSRLAAVLPPAGPGGPYVSIRRFSKDKLTLQKLLAFGALTEDAADLLNVLVCSKMNIVVAGGTASGKTSLLNAVSAFIPEHERVIVIEDSKELQLQREHVVHLEARPKDPNGRGEVTIRQLFKTTLRMRPDRVVIGEIRGGEALDLVQAMTSGHGGSLTTLHATYPRDVLSRIETMALMSDVGLPLIALRSQVASAINIVVQVTRARDGSRMVTHVSEIAGFDLDRNQYVVNDLYLREFDGVDQDGRVLSRLLPTGSLPTMLDGIRAHGYDVPEVMLEAARQRGI